MKSIKYILFASVLAYGFSACRPAGDQFAGSEYMPDMAHSVAYEANTYHDYYYNSWTSESQYSKRGLGAINKPVSGTIARGYAGMQLPSEEMMNILAGKNSLNAIKVPVNGSVPYYYKDTEEERTRAIAEIISNPFPITDKGLAQGENLYNVYCGICHGAKGDGAGYLVREASAGDAGGVYPAAPANFLTDEFVGASNGRYYHAIMYGKNVMGGYTDKLSYEERWQVIHWIRSLQASEKKLVYSAKANTLNPQFGNPVSGVAPIAQLDSPVTDTIAVTPAPATTSHH